MYWHPVFYFTIFYFLIGAASIAYINSKTQAGKQERWIKFGVYILIVHAIILSILFAPSVYKAIAVSIAAGGLIELILAWKRSSRSRGFLFAALCVFLPLAAAFLWVSFWGIKAWLYFLVVTFDGFSQITGQAFGKAKLVPKISPGKTVAGLIGGMVITVFTACIIVWMGELDASVKKAIIGGIVVSLVALAGDLLASFYKRKTGIKDFSNLIPGHGGVLDRFDSFIAVCAMIGIAVFAIEIMY
jgi:phosphatidate cytidylyltransferase